MIIYHDDPFLIDALLTFTHERASGRPVKLYLAEGDSWFSIGGATSNLLMALDDPDTLIVSCAYPGDTLRNMRQIGNRVFWNMVMSNRDIPWDGVLISAGGNDILGDIGSLVESGKIGHARLRIALEGIDAGYREIVETVRKHNNCPIHAHTYDFPVSDYKGGWFRAGPWVGKTLANAGIPPQRHETIIRTLINLLAEHILSIPGLTVHDTRGTLGGAQWGWFGAQKHWRNEIHPTKAGYDLLAARWSL